MNDKKRLMFNLPPGWPKPPDGWTPPKGWVPDPSWPEPPSDWKIWIAESEDTSGAISRGELDARSPPPAQQTKNDSKEISSRNVEKLISLLEAENEALRSQLLSTGLIVNEVILLDDERVLQEVGIYRYHHPLENAVLYVTYLDELTTRITEMVKAGIAIEKSNTFTFNGSLAKGHRMTCDLGKLMLRAYNAEAENAVRSLRAGNVVTAIKRLEASRATIANLGKMMEMRISDSFHTLRIEEIKLTADYLMKKQEEREVAREERERLREERKVALELAAEREQLDKERSHLMTALEKLRSVGSDDLDLERKLTEIDGAIARNDYRVANIRAGYVYVISNRGAFGDNVVKIGLTRRLEPQDRINELGDASVPFRFDVHAIYFSEDAVTLENELHQYFSDRRVNCVNTRREFFFATASEVRAVLTKKLGNMLEFTEHAESTEYLQSVHYWPEVIQPSLSRTSVTPSR